MLFFLSKMKYNVEEWRFFGVGQIRKRQNTNTIFRNRNKKIDQILLHAKGMHRGVTTCVCAVCLATKILHEIKKNILTKNVFG